MGMLRSNQGKTAEAAKYFSIAQGIDPGSVEASLNWGFMEQIAGNWDRAAGHYRAAADHQPNGPVDYFYHAVSSVHDGQLDQALQYFNEAVHMDPNFWQARYFFGQELTSQGRLEEAQAQFSRVVHTRPDFVPGHLNNGLALARLGKPGEALQEFQTTLRLDPANTVARQNLEVIQTNISANISQPVKARP
jgi:tetratricopeptide (TPR) repeat protein